MALTINTNMGSLLVQRNMASATNSLNKSIERMTTGYKINAAKDDAAGYFVAKNMQVQLSSTSVAQDNCDIGTNLLSTVENNYDLLTTHLQRIRDLTEQAANGTYGQESIDAIKSEIQARLAEMDRVASSCEFNGINLMDGSAGEINIQCGIDSTANSQIKLSADLFADSVASTLMGVSAKDFLAQFTAGSNKYNTALDQVDKAIKTISTRQTQIGAYQNRIESASDALNVRFEQTTSALSTIRDADVAEESSAYIKAQILQQASASLLATANQTPSIALNLI